MNRNMIDGRQDHLAQVALYGRYVFERGLASSTGGNISCRAGESVLISTHGSCLGDLDEASTVSVSLGGELLQSRRPSSELPVHLEIYRQFPGVGGIVHGHSPYAVAASTLLELSDDDALPAYSAGYLIRVGSLPLIPFIESGSPALAHRVAEAIGRSGHAVLIRNHGFFAVGGDLAEAFYTADELQDALRVYMFSSGQAVALPPEVCDRIRAAHRDGPVRTRPQNDENQRDAEMSRP